MNRATLQLIWDDKVTFYEFKGWWEHPKIYFSAPAWKNNLHDVSCIPQGLYNISRADTPTHKDIFIVHNVPNRTGILIHPGNYASVVNINGVPHLDSDGCYMPGFGYDKTTPMIKNSVAAMDYLRDNIKDNFALEVRFNLPPEESI